MTHTVHTQSNDHRELLELGRDGLRKLVRTWVDPFPPPVVTKVPLDDGRVIQVVRDDLTGLGTKIRAASAIFHQTAYQKFDTIIYVAPRAGWAPISLAKLCAVEGKRLILFCPASAVISHHQRVAYELGAELRFVRIAAMPVLQGFAKKFAEQHGYLFFPLGLAVPAAVAGIAKVASSLAVRPPQVWSVISTGVLTRGLQLAWPTADHHAVAVSRNIKAGEKGTATLYSHPRPFLQDAPRPERPPFPSASNYDAKGWVYLTAHACHNALYWNVAGEIEMAFHKPLPQSDRAWGDYSALQGD